MDPVQAEAIASAMDAMQGTANAVATGNIAINLSLSTSLKLLWGMVNTFQFIVFFTDWKVQMPANAALAIKTFRIIALGEFIPYHWLTDPLEDATSGSEENAKANVMANMGIMLVILLIVIILIVLVVACAKLCKTDSLFHRFF